MPAKIKNEMIRSLQILYVNRVPAKDVAAELDVSYQTVYSYYRQFKAQGMRKISIRDILRDEFYGVNETTTAPDAATNGQTPGQGSGKKHINQLIGEASNYV